MTAREMIAKFFETNEHGTVKQIMKFAGDEFKVNNISLSLTRMASEGKVITESQGRNRGLTYYLARKEDERPHKAIKTFLLANPRSTVEQIAEGSGISIHRVRIYLNSRHNAGNIDRGVNSSGEAVWAFKKEMPFGCGNEFVLALNNALRAVRESREQNQ